MSDTENTEVPKIAEGRDNFGDDNSISLLSKIAIDSNQEEDDCTIILIPSRSFYIIYITELF